MPCWFNRVLLFTFSGLLLALYVDFPLLAVLTGFASAFVFGAVETYLYPKLSNYGEWRMPLRGLLIFVFGELSGVLIIGIPLAMRYPTPIDSLEAVRATLGWGGALGLGVGAVGTILTSFQTRVVLNEEQERDLIERERQAAELRALAAHAETAALRAQINPHFLYNALNTLAYLIEENPPAARRVVEKLARIFRRTLERSANATTTLHEELEFVHDYLGIELERFDDVLRVESHIDPATLCARVPTMMLQPLAENSIKHGICPVANGGTLILRTMVVGGATEERRLRIELSDDGRGMDAARLTCVMDGSAGIGISNVRDRLKLQYGDAATVDVQSVLGVGTLVTLEFPYEITQQPEPAQAVA